MTSCPLQFTYEYSWASIGDFVEANAFMQLHVPQTDYLQHNLSQLTVGALMQCWTQTAQRLRGDLAESVASAARDLPKYPQVGVMVSLRCRTVGEATALRQNEAATKLLTDFGRAAARYVEEAATAHSLQFNLLHVYVSDDTEESDNWQCVYTSQAPTES